MDLTEAAYKVIKHTLKMPPATRVASVQAVELLTLAGMALHTCPNCNLEDWRGSCDLCKLMTRLISPCPFPAVGSLEWAWTKAQKWEARWVHRWTSPFCRFWIAEDDNGYVVDSDERDSDAYAVVSTIELAQRIAEFMARNEWESKR